MVFPRRADSLEPWERRDGASTCSRGHAWTRENVYVRPDGSARWCLRCRDDQRKVRRPSERAAMLRRKYNLTVEEYNAILDAQGGACAVCGKPAAEMAKSPHVDHDHRTLILRGLLCFGCNALVVSRHRDAEVFERAAAYLRNPPAVAVLGERHAPPRKRKRKRKSRAA